MVNMRDTGNVILNRIGFLYTYSLQKQWLSLGQELTRISLDNMKLLIVTQAVDTEDPVLGFFVRWIEELGKHVESNQIS